MFCQFVSFVKAVWIIYNTVATIRAYYNRHSNEVNNEVKF